MRLGTVAGTLARMSHTVTPTGSRRPEFHALEDRMRWARETKPLTQAELAAHLGISKRTVQNYEAGVGYPLEDRLVLWANACDVDFFWLAGDFYPNRAARSAASSSTRVKTQSFGGCMRSTRLRTAHRATSCDPLAA